jgi:putative NADH-flavin reductase
MSRIRSILVLGAYGLVGREIVPALLSKTQLAVTASGRSAEKLEALAKRLPNARLSTRRLDAYDTDALASACLDADLVINAVGPYAAGGADIARTVLESDRAYVDFANEQSHYRRLESLDALARERNLLLLTGAGAIPGLSTLMVMQAAERLPDIDEVELYYAQGRAPDAESGFGSFMGFVLELSFLDRPLETRVAELPAPFARAKALLVPTLEALTVPRRTSVRSLANWWAMGEVPPGMNTMIRLLKPHRRKWAHRLFAALVRQTMRGEYRRAVKKGLTTAGVIKLVARSPRAQWEAILPVDDGGLATAFLPVLAAKQRAEGRLEHTGLVTPIDVFEPSATFSELAALGWVLQIQTTGR